MKSQGHWSETKSKSTFSLKLLTELYTVKVLLAWDLFIKKKTLLNLNDSTIAKKAKTTTASLLCACVTCW